jgi:hypothetical protein
MTLRSISRLGGMQALLASALALPSCGGGNGDATAASAPPKTSSGRAGAVSVANAAAFTHRFSHFTVDIESARAEDLSR